MLEVVDGVPQFPLNLADADLVQDPWAALAVVREAGSVVFNPAIGRWMIAGYEDSRRALANERQIAPDGEFFVQLFGAHVMESMDTPRQTEVRGIWANRFHRGSVAEL